MKIALRFPPLMAARLRVNRFDFRTKTNFRIIVFCLGIFCSALSHAQPVITALGSYIDTPGKIIGISGSGFSSTPANNVVHFGATRAAVSSATTTSLTVRVPNGATFAPVSVLNTATGLKGSSGRLFLPTYDGSDHINWMIRVNPKVDFKVNNSVLATYIVDVDGDTLPDIATVNFHVSGSTVSILRNTGLDTIIATSFASRVDIPVVDGAQGLAVEDIDGDGKPDLVVTSSESVVGIYRNIGTPGSVTTGSFAAGVTFAVPSAQCPPEIRDIDRDGKPDIIVAGGTSDSVFVLKNTSTVGTINSGSFAGRQGYAVVGNPTSIVVRDMDLDGKEDIVVTNADTSIVSVFRNIGSTGVINSSTFATRVDLAILGHPSQLICHDFDGIAPPDIAVVSADAYRLYFFRNISSPGSLGFASRTDWPIIGPVNVTTADMNGDSLPDIIMSRHISDRITIWRNLGTPGSLGSGAFSIGGYDLTYKDGLVVAGDLNHDQMADLVAIGANDSMVSVYQNTNPVLPPPIVGTSPICVGTSYTFTHPQPGGTWSVSNSRAMVGAFTGIVTGLSAGTVHVTYTRLGIPAVMEVEVKAIPVPGSIGGNALVALGGLTTLSNGIYDGTETWTSSNTAIATVPSYFTVYDDILNTYKSVAYVYGVALGTATISYSVTNMCGTGHATRIVTVSLSADAGPILAGPPGGSGGGPGPVPGPSPGGGFAACPGTTIQLENINGTAGTWSSSPPTVGSIHPVTGVVTGVSAGTMVVTYTLPSGNKTTKVITINPLPSPIVGPSIICLGLTVTMTGSPGGGVWSSSAPGIASVNTTGSVTGYSLGTATISYTIPATWCMQVKTVTVSPFPGAVSGSNDVCVGTTTTYTNTMSGGSWSSSVPAKGTINATTGAFAAIAAGVTVISYTMPSGCGTALAVTVSPNPGSITGPNNVCVGQTIALGNVTSGGVWSSSAWGTGTIHAGTGVTGGINAGTTTITYRFSNNCKATTVVTVNPSPPNIGGTPQLCVGATTTLTNSLSGGTWSSSVTAKGTVGSTTGIVGGISAGTTVITYGMATGCSRTITVSVIPMPAAITGPGSVCDDQTITMGNTVPSGVWSSSTPTVGSISTVGVVRGMSPGTTTITYGFASNFCKATTVVTVYALPAAITGTPQMCVGAATTLANSVSGGTWSSSNTAKGTVGATNGVVGGISAGTAIITYEMPGACRSVMQVTVIPMPAAITGSGTVCQGLTTTLANTVTGGSWSSSTPSVGTVSAGGVVAGLSEGTTTITYAFPAGCQVTTVVTVNGAAAAITGTPQTCVGATTTLANAVTGGTWSSSTPAKGTVGLTTGVVGGIASGTTTITYTTTAGCRASATVTVFAMPGPITGTGTLCEGQTTTLANTVSGGTWSSSTPTIGSVSVAGLVAGISEGTTTITYAFSATCGVTTVVTVNESPAAITGTPQVCVGATTALANATSGGTWSSSVIAKGTVGATTGVVGGIATGTTVITYALPSGCRSTTVATIISMPGPITGPGNVCQGLTTTLANTVPGGIWSSSVPAIGTISAAGVVGGISEGNTTITYGFAGCSVTTIVTVNISPAAITGTPQMCVGATTTLANATSGGTWSSSTTAKGTVGLNTGIVGGIASGTTTITYALPSGCRSTTMATVFAMPGPITGSGTVCQGLTTTLANTVTGGAWSSSTPTVGSVNASGVVAGLSEGTTTITYAVTAACSVTTVVTVNGSAAPITGTPQMCVGATTTLANAVAGGTWSSSTPAKGTVGLTTGIVGGISSGTTIVTYTTASGCMSTAMVTVVAMPGPITGSGILCQGLTTTLGNAVTGGTWSSSAPTIGTVSAAGVVGGISEGTTTITYAFSGTCSVTTVVTVNEAATPVTGTQQICVGATTTLANATPGGTWSSSLPSKGTVGLTTGVVGGVSAGTTLITYTLPVGCRATMVVSVTAMPGAITGSGTVCQGQTTTLGNTATGGTWSSSVPTIGTVSATGVVGGLLEGTTTITYAFSAACLATKIVTVSSAAAPITGTQQICVGATTTLANSVAGGTWSSSLPAKGTVGLTTGVVGGIASGTTVITYTLAGGCRSIMVVSVIPMPGPITGSGTVCQGLTTTLGNTVPGGAWSSSTPAVGSISNVAVLGGISVGTTTITYAFPAGCTVTTVVTVNTSPEPITGTSQICVGATTSLASATTGGTWSSSAPIKGTVGLTTGVVGGIAAGFTVITYTMPGSCRTTLLVSVIPMPGPITGAGTVCEGQTTTMGNSVPGGAWSSSVPAIGTISNFGVVGGISDGTTTITYAFPAGCTVTRVFTVNGSATPITGTSQICVGTTTALANATPGGTWSSSAPAKGTVGLTTGVVGGIAAGFTVITYTLPGGCRSTMLVSVIPMPGAITGSGTVCQGQTTTLGNTVPGGSWSSSVSTVGTISTTGVLDGIAVGTTTITYAFPAGCSVTRVVSVNASPEAITGSPQVCVGQTTALASATVGGTWSSSVPSRGTVGLTTGLVGGVTAGTTVITYLIPGGCRSTLVVSVFAMPGAITGTATVCEGQTTVLGNSVSGGVWSSSVPAIGSVSTAGVVTGLLEGTTTVTYQFSAACSAAKVVTVNASPAAITGTQQVCVGQTTALASATPGGTWSSSLPARGTVGLTTGLVGGVTAGTTVITYLMPGGCRATVTVTVRAMPGPITGSGLLCEGMTAVLGNSVPGGTWSSSLPAIGSVSNAGTVTGIAAGTTIITYGFSAECNVTTPVTVQAPPAVITGPSQVCVGTTITLTNATPGGTWSSNLPARGSVDVASGIVGGIAAGTVIITYGMPAGCIATKNLTVDAMPPAITGAGAVCEGFTTTLSNSVAGGTWSSSAPATGSVDAAGVVSGLAAGTTTITYVLPSGCNATRPVTVNSLPQPITGTAEVCAGQSTTLSNATTGGTWSSSNTAIGTVSSSGVVTGITNGITTIAYTLPTGCVATIFVSVHALPASITGDGTVCVGNTTALYSATAGGAWSSSTLAIGTIDGSGIFTGIAAGSATVSYTLPTSCIATREITVAVPPANITGMGEVCSGSSIALSNTSAGGSWSSSDNAVGSVNASGVVAGLSAGTTMISYTLAAGCLTEMQVSVHPLPAAITGDAAVCQSFTTALGNATPAGTWSSSAPAIGSIDVSGMITGSTPGTTIITYMLPTGCKATLTMTVHSVPTGITGPVKVCEGAQITLGNAVNGGSWVSSTPTAGSISTSGVVTGIAAGTTTVTYTLAAGCSVTTDVTVQASPAPITGAGVVCESLFTPVVNATGGGTWTSSNDAVSTVNSWGVVAGIAAGEAIITYTIPAGCFATRTVTVLAAPGDITGVGAVCEGQATVLHNAAGGGTWSNSDIAVGSIDASGAFSGLTVGTAVVTYTLPTGCISTREVTVNELPAAITGTGQLCNGLTATFADNTPAGSWSSSLPAVGTIDAFGAFTGVAAGTTTITYALFTGCSATFIATVDPLPAPIAGVMQVCEGATSTLNNATPGGTWSSSDIATGSIDAVSGTLTGLSAGVTYITYALPTSCMVTAKTTVNALPAMITGDLRVCKGLGTTLSSATPGGTWASSPAAIAPIGYLTGVIAGVTPGSTTITYQLPDGCIATREFMVDALPSVDTVIGGGGYCLGGSGRQVQLTTSQVGNTYTLYYDGAAILSALGTGSMLDLGVHAGVGIYTVTATNSRSCTSNMYGSAIVSIAPFVTPAVNILTNTGDTVCAGTITEFTANPVNGGSNPLYLWRVNGINMATADQFSYTPVNGDIISVRLTSNVTCPAPDTAIAAQAMVVVPNRTPSIAISASADSVCQDTHVTFTATSVFGGDAPVYTWVRNGVDAANGSSWSYAPANGDMVYARLNSSYRCPTANNISSNSLPVYVDSGYIPVVGLEVYPGSDIVQGYNVEFKATVRNGGPAFTYQWMLNGRAIAGANTDSYSNAFLRDGDSVTCAVRNLNLCAYWSFNSVKMRVSSVIVQPVLPPWDIRLVPNPNNGDFVLTGNLANEEIVVRVFNMLGQVVYNKRITQQTGVVKEYISLENTLANGMYLLKVTAGNESKVLHFVLKR